MMVLNYLKDSLSRLSRFFTYANSKIHRHKSHKLYRITFKKTSGLSSTFIYLISEDRPIKMHYSIPNQEYFIEIWLAPLSEFYIIQQGKQYLVDSFPQVTNKSGKVVNLTPKPRKFTFVNIYAKISKNYSRNFYFDSSGYSVGKLAQLNEDAFFCNEQALGIADGIGSIKTEFGISSWEFSHELMKKCEMFTRELMDNHRKQFTCKNIIKNAYQMVESGGGSTFLLTILSGRQLNILNLGDSGMILARHDRNFKIVFQTTPKLHNSCIPYQLTRKFSSKQLLQNTNLTKNLDKSDDVNDADEFMITTLPGDIVVMGSDGLWDNMSPNEVTKILDQYNGQSVQKLSSIITKIAKIRTVGMNAVNLAGELVFTKSLDFVGKPDDITVIVARIIG